MVTPQSIAPRNSLEYCPGGRVCPTGPIYLGTISGILVRKLDNLLVSPE